MFILGSQSTLKNNNLVVQYIYIYQEIHSENISL